MSEGPSTQETREKWLGILAVITLVVLLSALIHWRTTPPPPPNIPVDPSRPVGVEP